MTESWSAKRGLDWASVATNPAPFCITGLITVRLTSMSLRWRVSFSKFRAARRRNSLVSGSSSMRKPRSVLARPITASITWVRTESTSMCWPDGVRDTIKRGQACLLYVFVQVLRQFGRKLGGLVCGNFSLLRQWYGLQSLLSSLKAGQYCL